MAVSSSSITIRAYAKINLTLRVTGTRPDGYHELRTVFQTISLHDTVIVARRPGPLRLSCSDVAVPTGPDNLAWKAVAALRRAIGKTGEPRGVEIRIVKRIPMQAGLGGGSSDAAAVLRALACLWRVPRRIDLAALAATLGADVPFFLRGGTALGLARGDLLYALPDLPAAWLVLVLPAFGVSTVEAYGWYDRDRVAPAKRSRTRGGPEPSFPAGWPLPVGEMINDLEPPVARRHPEIAAIARHLAGAGAAFAAMSGSGSAVFGLFASRAAADRAAARCRGRGWRAHVARTVAAFRASGE